MKKAIRNFKIRTKAMATFSLVIVICLAMITVNIVLMTSFIRQTNYIVEVMDPVIISAFNLRNSFSADIRAVEEYANGYGSLDEAEKKVFASEKEIEQEINTIEESGVIESKTIAELRQILAADEDKDEAVFAAKKNAVSDPSNLIVTAEVRQAMTGFDEDSQKVSEAIEAIIDNIVAQKVSRTTALENRADAYRTIIALSFVVALIASMLLAILASSRLTKSIKRISAAAQKMSQGDLSQRVEADSKDEIGELYGTFNQMAAKLQQLTINLEDKVFERTRELQTEKAQLHASIESLTAGFLLVNRSGVIRIQNKSLQNILGLSHPATNLQQLNSELSKVDLATVVQKVQTNQQSIELKEISAGSKILHIFATPVKMLDAGKPAVIGTVILIEDITESKIIERSKDEFFSIASHELRTPLTSIKGNASLILQFYADILRDKDLKEMVSDIHTSSIRLIEIVNDFLDVSRLEQGKMAFNSEEFSIEQIIESVIYEMKTVVADKHLHMGFDKMTLDSLPKIWADKNRTKQIVYNLVGNAVKFTDHGGITIKASAEEGFVKVQVADSGPGISSEAQRLLFHKFQQTGSSLLTRDSTRGTGLGLYISKMMAESMGGRIYLERSNLGEGSVFSFTLPIAPSKPGWR